jgi:hypothetical protein
MRNRVVQFLFVLLLAAGSACGQGTIQYVDINPDLFMFSAWTRRDVPIDLDQDGTPDLVFRATPSQFDIYGLGANRVLAFPNNPPDLTRYAVPVATGDTISSSLQPQYIWAESIFFGSPSDPLGVVFNGGFETIIGTFVNRRGYVGLELQTGGNTHYGWIRLDCETFSNNGGYVLDYAYELRPGASILAGAVPEPSTWALLSAGGILFWFLRRGKRVA